MKAILLTITIVFSLNGCAYFNTVQTDISPNERTITTKVTGYTLFSSTQNISKLKAIQTEKTQSVGTDAVGQQGATNVVEGLRVVGEILKLIK